MCPDLCDACLANHHRRESRNQNGNDGRNQTRPTNSALKSQPKQKPNPELTPQPKPKQHPKIKQKPTPKLKQQHKQKSTQKVELKQTETKTGIEAPPPKAKPKPKLKPKPTPKPQGHQNRNWNRDKIRNKSRSRDRNQNWNQPGPRAGPTRRAHQPGPRTTLCQRIPLVSTPRCGFDSHGCLLHWKRVICHGNVAAGFQKFTLAVCMRLGFLCNFWEIAQNINNVWCYCCGFKKSLSGCVCVGDWFVIFRQIIKQSPTKFVIFSRFPKKHKQALRVFWWFACDFVEITKNTNSAGHLLCDFFKNHELVLCVWVICLWFFWARKKITNNVGDIFVIPPTSQTDVVCFCDFQNVEK